MPRQVVHRVESYSAVKRASVCGVNSLTIVVLSGLASVCRYVPLAYTCHPKTQLPITSIAAVRRNKPETKFTVMMTVFKLDKCGGTEVVVVEEVFLWYEFFVWGYFCYLYRL